MTKVRGITVVHVTRVAKESLEETTPKVEKKRRGYVRRRRGG